MREIYIDFFQLLTNPSHHKTSFPLFKSNCMAFLKTISQGGSYPAKKKNILISQLEKLKDDSVITAIFSSENLIF